MTIAPSLQRILGGIGLAVLLAAAGLAVFRATGPPDRKPSGQAAGHLPAQRKCPEKLVRDWADGRIDGTYPVACYRAALRSLPADLQVYSSAPEDISQALSRRIVQGRTHAKRANGG